MKNQIKPIFVALAISLLFALTSANVTYAQTEADGAALESVIQAVKLSLKDAQSNNVNGFPPLKKVKIELNTVAKKSGGVNISFLIFSIGSRTGLDTAAMFSIYLKFAL